MARPAKYSEEQLMKITQDFLNDGPLGRPTYQKLSDWAKQKGYNIGEQAFRSRPQIVLLIKQAKERYQRSGSEAEEGAYITFDIRNEMTKVQSKSDMQKLLDTLMEREAYFKNLYERNCALSKIVRRQVEQLAQAAEKVQNLEEEIVQIQRQNITYKHQNVEFRRKNSRMKAMLEEQIYPEIVLSELDELGLQIERSKITEPVRERMVADGNGQSHTELTNKVIPLLRKQVEHTEPELLVEDAELQCEKETVNSIEEFKESDIGIYMITQMQEKFNKNP